MLDFLRKDVVADWTSTNFAMNRNFEEKVLVNGHPATILRTKPAAVVVGTVYRVYDPSVKSYKFVLHAGYAELSVYENTSSSPVETLYEEAQLNKLMNPVITMTFDSKPSQSLFNELCAMYFDSVKSAMKSLNEAHYEISHSSAYDKRYPYDWIYFKKYRRVDVEYGRDEQ